MIVFFLPIREEHRERERDVDRDLLHKNDIRGSFGMPIFHGFESQSRSRSGCFKSPDKQTNNQKQKKGSLVNRKLEVASAEHVSITEVGSR